MAGVRLVNERLATEVEHLRMDLMVASACYVMVCLVVANLEQMFFTYRMEFGAELKVELMDRPQALLMRLRP